MKKIIVLVVLFAAAASGGGAWWLYHGNSGGETCAALHSAFPTFAEAPGAPQAPDVAFADGDGAVRTLADYRGLGVVLNFWATWCAPCVREMPALDRAHAVLSGKGVAVLAVSNDRGGADVVRAFFREHEISGLPVLTDAGMALARRFGVRGLPTTGFIGADGRVLGHIEGVAEWDSEPVLTALAECLGPDKETER